MSSRSMPAPHTSSAIRTTSSTDVIPSEPARSQRHGATTDDVDLHSHTPLIEPSTEFGQEFQEILPVEERTHTDSRLASFSMTPRALK